MNNDEEGEGGDSFITKLKSYGAEMSAFAREATEMRKSADVRSKNIAGVADEVFDGDTLLGEKKTGSIYVGPMSIALKSKGKREILKDHNITSIVNCTGEIPCEYSDLDYCVVPVQDMMGSDILSYLDGATAFIHSHVTGQANNKVGNVLVHCHMGISRSVTVAIAYLIKYQKMSRDDAFLLVKSCRRQAKPNVGFWKQLEEFEQRVKEQSDGHVHPSSSGTELEFNYLDWVKKSSMTFCTLGTKFHMNQSKELISKICFGEIEDRLKTGGSEEIEQVLHAAMTHVWSRGLLEFDLKWLQTLLVFMNDLEGAFKSGGGLKEIVLGMFNKGAKFHDLWTGEIYPDHLQKIQDLLVILDPKEEDEADV